MLDWFKQLDRLLRGDATRPELLRQGSVDIPLGPITVISILLGIIYGICMGVFSLTASGSHDPRQMIAAAIKVPALFFLTLLVTFPSLYVFNALVGSRLGLVSVLRLLVASISIMITVLASLGPIVAFFSLTTTSYPFMKLLNVAVFAISGFLGCAFLLRTLERLTAALEPPAHAAPLTTTASGSIDAPPVPPEGAQSLPPALPRVFSTPPTRPANNVRTIFQIWVIVFGLVGAQMGWILRPFIGNPTQPFEWFRPVDSNFFQAVWRSLENLFQ